MDVEGDELTYQVFLNDVLITISNDFSMEEDEDYLIIKSDNRLTEDEVGVWNFTIIIEDQPANGEPKQVEVDFALTVANLI